MIHVGRSAAVVLLGLLILSSCGEKAPTEINWASSLEEASQLAPEKNQFIVAEFWRDG